jgi:hypothetical protein
MSLAAERTYLAYLRTGLALLAAGVAVAGALPEAGGATLRRGVGLLLVLIAGVLLASARPRWKAVDLAMRRGEPLPRSRVPSISEPRSCLSPWLPRWSCWWPDPEGYGDAVKASVNSATNASCCTSADDQISSSEPSSALAASPAFLSISSAILPSMVRAAMMRQAVTGSV